MNSLMTRKQLTLLLFLSTLTVCYAQRNDEKTLLQNDFLESRSFDANTILLDKITNRGDFNSASWSSLNYGTLPAKRVLFDAGFWVSGFYNGEIRSAIKYYSANYSPGPIINGRPAMDESPSDSLRYRVYKVFKGNDPQNPDLLEWPADFGAPTNEQGEPIIFGDQILWSVYNMFDSNSVNPNFVTTKQKGILPIEVQQKIYGREGNKKDFENIFHNVFFIEWTIINKGSSSIDSAFIGLWADIDFYDINSNIPAVDIDRQTGYLWSGIDFTPSLGGVPPSVGLTLLYGPVKSHPDSTAIFKGREISGKYNLGLNSFKGIGDDTNLDPLYGPPRNEVQVYSSANGFSNGGGIIIDPTTTRSTKFPFSGDPINETGWLFPSDKVGNGSGIILFTGPFDLAPSDTQWVMAAFVPGLGVDKKESIIKMREKIDILHSQPYDSLAFGNTPIIITSLEENLEELPQTFTLSQNYPNPFNPSTTIEFNVPLNTTRNVKLSIYNILGQEIKTLLNKPMSPGHHSITFDASELSTGVYVYKLSSESTIISKKMILIK